MIIRPALPRTSDVHRRLDERAPGRRQRVEDRSVSALPRLPRHPLHQLLPLGTCDAL
ncbi:hypothetical protein [Kitasatospora sp. NPDC050463]|uniref:hypothetical protein n=1 Tax=Kitasatospora sp. NPDC050463 TaxID=3155786 RepID=UPI0033D6BAE0